jgi:hypothetical protein
MVITVIVMAFSSVLYHHRKDDSLSQSREGKITGGHYKENIKMVLLRMLKSDEPEPRSHHCVRLFSMLCWMVKIELLQERRLVRRSRTLVGSASSGEGVKATLPVLSSCVMVCWLL